MSLTLFIYAEQKTDKGWELPLGMMDNPDFDTTCSHYLSRRCPVELFWSTNKALRAILGYSDKRFCSTTDFESVAIEAGLPKDHSYALLERFPYGSLGDNSEVWTVDLVNLLAFPFYSKTIVRETDVSQDVAHYFKANASGPRKGWPSEIPLDYSLAKRNGVKVEWVETYAEAMGEDFFVALEKLKGLQGEIRLVCIVG
ncbi:MAG: hypothetical protein RLZZ519_1421 [Bacteroidota bacterium]|jgi:hypothetical protein